MSTPIGSVIVILAIVTGFGLSGGNFLILFQPNEFIVICGAAFGSLFISAPGKIRSQVFKSLKGSLTLKMPTKEEFLELLKLQYEVYSFVRRNGAVALESHLAELEKSDIFKKYPTFLNRHHAVEFFRDALNQMVNGTGPEEMDMLLEAELETHHQESHIPIGLINKVGDAMPGLGIVAAVLGIIITMGHLDGGPEEMVTTSPRPSWEPSSASCSATASCRPSRPRSSSPIWRRASTTSASARACSRPCVARRRCSRWSSRARRSSRPSGPAPRSSRPPARRSRAVHER